MSMAETNATFEGLWKNALDRYQTFTGHDLSTQSATLGPQTIRDVQDRIKLTNEKFDSFRHKHEQLSNILGKTLQPLERIMSIAKSGFSNSALGPVSSVFTVSIYLVRACKDVSSAYDLVECMLEDLTVYTSLLELDVEDGDIRPILQANIVEIMVDLLMMLEHTEKIVKEGRFSKCA